MTRCRRVAARTRTCAGQTCKRVVGGGTIVICAWRTWELESGASRGWTIGTW